MYASAPSSVGAERGPYPLEFPCLDSDHPISVELHSDTLIEEHQPRDDSSLRNKLCSANPLSSRYTLSHAPRA